MTYSYTLKTAKADSKGGIRYILGPAFKITEEEPEKYVRSVIEANMHPKGAIIERVAGKVFREVLGIEGGVILRFHESGGPGHYVLFHSSPLLLSAEPPRET